MGALLATPCRSPVNEPLCLGGMWALENRTPYAVGKSWVRDQAGKHLWLVAVKATFDIGRGGKLSLAREQMPVSLQPEFWGDPFTTSLRSDADVVPIKATTDVLLEGSAYAPHGRATRSVPVTLRVGGLQKSLVVYGPRVYFRSMGTLAISSPVAFEVQPIRYEHAFGGADLESAEPSEHRYDARNPVGRGVVSRTEKLIDQPAHSVEHADGSAQRAPAGFGPIASFWSPRRERAGTYGEQWEKTRKPLLPADYDERHLQCAPEDQWSARHLYGGEPVALLNLSPHGPLQFALPKISLVFATRFGSRREIHQGRLGTVLIQPDVDRLQLVWQTALPVSGRDVDYLDETVIDEKPHLGVSE